MRKTKRSPAVGDGGARKFDLVDTLIGSDKTKSAARNQAKTLPSKATLARKWPSLRINRFNGKWRDFASGEHGSDLESLRAYLDGAER